MPGQTFSLPEHMRRATRADWDAAVVTALKGGDPARLKTVTRDGIVLEPLVAGPVAATPLPSWRAPGRWQVVTRIDLPDVAAANAQILADLAGGADGVTLVFASSPWARGFGLPEDTDFVRLLAGVATDLVPLRIEAGGATALLAGRLAATAPNAVIVAALDPLALALAGGSQAGAGSMADGRIIHDAGGSDGQELAYVVAAAVAALRHGAGPEAIGFTLAADADQFATIAKFRALRLLWALVQEEAGMAPVPARIHGETAWRMMSRLDCHSNILRGAIAAFAAGVGGADSLTVLPFTAPLGLSDGFARRVARNTQRVILDEANLWRVADAGAGSGAIEAETAALAETAWGLFQAIERTGGPAEAIRNGSLQRDVLTIAAERARDIARRKVALTGASEYPQLGVAPPAVLAPASPVPEPQGDIVPLPARRLAAPFEALRERAAHRSPTAFFATLGPLAEVAARAAWTRTLLEAGGIAAPAGDRPDGLDALVAAFVASGTPLAVIVGSDARYADGAAPAARALAAAGATTILLAGKPGDAAFEAALREAGVTGFLFAGMDVVAALDDLLTRMGA